MKFRDYIPASENDICWPIAKLAQSDWIAADRGLQLQIKGTPPGNLETSHMKRETFFVGLLLAISGCGSGLAADHWDNGLLLALAGVLFIPGSIICSRAFMIYCLRKK